MDNDFTAKALININQLAMEAIRNENYKSAIDYFTQSLVLEEKLGMKAQMAESFYNMASAYFLMEEYDSALYKARLAEELFRQTEKKTDVEKTQNMINAIEEKQDL